MFRSFMKLFGPKQLGVFTAVSLLKFQPYMMTSE